MRNWNASRLARTCCAVRSDLAEGVPDEPSLEARGRRRLMTGRSRIQKNTSNEKRRRTLRPERMLRCLAPSPTIPSATTASAKKIPTKPERDGDARHASATAARGHVGEQRVVLGQRQLSERHGDSGGEQQR